MTLDRESELTLDADAVAAAAFLAERGGQLHVPVNGDSAVWWAELHPASDPGETYYARLGWSVYPARPHRSSSPDRWAGRSPTPRRGH